MSNGLTDVPGKTCNLFVTMTCISFSRSKRGRIYSWAILRAHTHALYKHPNKFGRASLTYEKTKTWSSKQTTSWINIYAFCAACLIHFLPGVSKINLLVMPVWNYLVPAPQGTGKNVGHLLSKRSKSTNFRTRTSSCALLLAVLIRGCKYLNFQRKVCGCTYIFYVEICMYMCTCARVYVWICNISTFYTESWSICIQRPKENKNIQD